MKQLWGAGVGVGMEGGELVSGNSSSKSRFRTSESLPFASSHPMSTELPRQGHLHIMLGTVIALACGFTLACSQWSACAMLV